MNFNFFKLLNQRFGIRLFAVSVFFILIVSCVFTLFFNYYQRRSLTGTLIEKGSLLSEVLAYNAKLGVFSENKTLLKDSIQGIFHQEEILEISVFNSKGDLLQRQQRVGKKFPEQSVGEDTSGNHAIFKRLNASKLPLYLELEDTFEFWSPIVSGSDSFTEESLYFETGPIREQERVIGYARITVDKTILDKNIHALLFTSILIGIFFLLIGSFVTYLFVKGITRPLNRLTEGVRAFSNTETFEKLPVETEDEIGKLAKAFNSISETLMVKEAEKQQLETQLRHSQKMEAIGTLSGGIAHDFNNIIGIVLGYTELALLDADKRTKLHHYLNSIFKAGIRAKDLVNQILLFSRQSKEERKPIQISLIVKEVVKMIRASLPTTIEIRQNIQDGSTVILSDPTQIHQVLMNLCTNAAHAMSERTGVLEVSLADVNIASEAAKQYPDMIPGQYQQLTVSDTGHGIDPSIMNRIFDPFFTTKGPGEGTGMGLSVVHGIVKSHGGAITCRSEPGQGSSFQVFFPAIERTLVEETEYEAPLPLGKERILFVDDEKEILDMGQQMLRGLGYKVDVRTNGIEALEVIRKQPDRFDLVITDMTMPKMTGADLAKEIMRLRFDIPVILCTGFSEMIYERKEKYSGIHEVVMKPIIRRDMAIVIRRVLDQEENHTES